eukprot:TRINITY_DN13018_c0_g1_i3.p1 TRINITY_DN13018_c0_g1~~TRINITY_DN13018_c0_g1_i3.p1  ORF type:complete len:233 (-),score=18.16 TRINITY_DN13018_c0_g1_i3:30-674(-)
MDRSTGPVWQAKPPTPKSPASFLKTYTGPMVPKDREEAAQGLRPRYEWVYDQAVPATHDRLNGVMRTQMDAWHVPKTSGTQNILRATSHIVDTTTRQTIARSYNRDFLQRTGQLDARVDHFAGRECGGGVRFRHDGTLELKKDSLRRSSSSPALPQEHEMWLPAWAERSHWSTAMGPRAPRWAGLPFNAMSKGPALWAGATLPVRASQATWPPA